jgi:hypothetical protein
MLEVLLTKSVEKKPVIRKAYKGFHQGLVCLNNFQYEVGKLHDLGDKDVMAYARGFHAYSNPIDVFHDYDPTEVFGQVVQSGTIDSCPVSCVEDPNDFSLEIEHRRLQASSKIKVTKLFSLHRFVLEIIRYFRRRRKDYPQAAEHIIAPNRNRRLRRSIVSTTMPKTIAVHPGPYHGIAVANQSGSVAFVQGARGIAETNQVRSVAFCDGLYSVAVAHLYSSVAGVDGRYSVALAGGQASRAETHDSYSVAVAAGSSSKAECNYETSVAVAAGCRGTALTHEKHGTAVCVAPDGLAECFGQNSVAVLHGVCEDWLKPYGTVRLRKDQFGGKASCGAQSLAVYLGYASSRVELSAERGGVAMTLIADTAKVSPVFSVAEGGAMLVIVLNDAGDIVNHCFAVVGEDVPAKFTYKYCLKTNKFVEVSEQL